jgi:hypothetical protein
MSGRGRILGPKNTTTFSGFWNLTENQQDVGTGNWAFFPVIATGGAESTITIDGINYKLHVFTGTGTFTVTSNTQNRTIDYMVQAGGGGGQRYSGGGGAGGQIQSGENQAPVFLPTARSYTVTVGAGGNVGNGSNTAIQDIVTVTGGGCSVTNGNSNSGGCGGGRQYNYAIGTGIAGPPRQGYDGGFGGGGTGVAGSLSNNIGGNGRTTTLRGTTEYFGGGGSGCGYATGVGGLGGGLGGGGNYNTAGAANTGGGGGSSLNDPPYSNAGGSGIVIIRYRTN